MTILSVIQDISTAIGVARPEAVFGSTEREHQELAALANEIGERIHAAYDWQRGMRVQTYTGDGVTTAFNLPTDYSRMVPSPDKSEALIRSSSMLRIEAITPAELLDMQVRTWSANVLSWTLLGGQMHFYPAPASGEVISWYYISTLYARSSGTTVSDYFPLDLAFDFADSDTNGRKKAQFDDDNDFFQLDERLLKLGMIWQWKANKGNPYAEDMQNYETHLAQRIARDPGQRGGSTTRRRGYGDVYAYPRAIVG